jgi:hypothetical protein
MESQDETTNGSKDQPSNERPGQLVDVSPNPIDTGPPEQDTEARAYKVKRLAKRWLAQASEPVSIYTLVLAVFTVILAVVSIKTLREIHEGGKDTHDLAVAAGKQADALVIQTQRSESLANATSAQAIAALETAGAAKSAADTATNALRQSRVAFAIDQRPYAITVGPIFVDLPITLRPSAAIALKDVGKTPAKSVSNVVDFLVFREMKLSREEAEENDQRFISFVQRQFDRLSVEPAIDEQDIAPDQTSPVSGRQLSSLLSLPDVGRIGNSEIYLIFLGIVRYKDSYGTGYQTDFCSYFGGNDTKIWRYCPTHNTIK